MSSTTSLSRTRSVRQPTAGRDRTSQRDGPTTRSEARTLSPSRLPVKPSMTTRSAAATAAASSTTTTTTTRTRASSSTTGRPLSGVYSKAPSTRPDYGNGAAKPLGRAVSTRQAPSSTTTAPPVTRSTSTASRPRSSGGPPLTASNRLTGHSRSKSTVTSLTAATTLRPISQRPTSQISSSSSGGRTSPTASSVITTSSKPQTRSQTHARAKSQSQSQSQTQTRSSSSTITTITTARATAQPPTALTKRPAFNTHQQHYSPAKSLAPKPLTSTFLAPPSPSKLPANVAISAETSRLQTELLQLSLLHRDAAAVHAEWHASARQKLEARFTRLASDNKALLSVERQGVEARNVAVLARWGSDNGRGLGLEEKVQILDEVLNGVWQLGEPGGRYQRVVAGFEAWAERMASIVSAQRSGNIDVLVDGEEVRFLGELDTSWKRDCMSLLRKLEGWSAALRQLGDVSSVTSSTDSSSSSSSSSSSGLERMVNGCRALVHDMLSELDLMSQIERDAARAEDQWIESMNKAIEDEDDDTPAARAYVPLWKLAT
ncbi:hypothetical protein F5Y06DRAFT_199093 [Hypoxylon sp. FL0890]|nr:hypothetical protein F5Y06DRAFT_199093 [Hypoxylon sp. FL0890]